jgi:serine/threonine protein kinase
MSCELPDIGIFPEHYEIREVLRESMVSTVLLAHDFDVQTDVVIKCFKPSAKGAYLREIAAAFDLNHPNLVLCLNTFYRQDGVPCIVYEYLSGGSLMDLLANQQRIGLASSIACLKDMLGVLAYLHSGNRIHCDLKPENILLRPKPNGDYDFVLIDLGAACFLREAQQGRHITGTPAYIAPERLNNRFFFNSDLYSLGVIAFEMCTGRRPFTGTLEELTQANLSEIPSLSEIADPGLRDFIDHLLVKHPLQRIEGATLALTLLNKAIGPSNQLTSNPFTIAENVNLQRILDVTEEPLAIHSFHIDNYPVVGLVYAHYVDIYDPLRPEQPFKTLLTSFPLQIVGCDALIYATPSRIQSLQLPDGHETLIKEGLHDLKSWRFEHSSLVWSNSYHTFYERFNSGAVARFEVSNYLFEPEASVFADGSFAISEGMAKNQIVLRDFDAKTLQAWSLKDPVIALNLHDTDVLVVTMNLDAGVSYSLWCLHENQPPRQLKLPYNTQHIQCINGLTFWLANQRSLECCDTRLEPKTLKQLACAACNFAASYDHRFFVMGFKDADNRLYLTFLTLELPHEIIKPEPIC